LVGDQLVGVLTVYSPLRDAFTEDHRRVMEVIGGQISRSFHRAVLFQSRRLHSDQDSGTGLPNVRHLERVVANELSTSSASGTLSVILIKVGPPARAHTNQWLPSSAVLSKVAESARSALRGADLLFHFSAKELAVLLLRTDSEAARHVADRVARHVNTDANEEIGGAVEVAVGVASAPDDGLSLDDLLRVAERRERTDIDSGENPPSIH
jgi:diguanylate cyclase (GGDEF)-like protein